MKSKLSTLVLATVVAAYSLSMLPLKQVAAQDDHRGLRVQQESQKERRVALIIGNSAYKDSPLTNPINDAQDMAAALRDLGFEIIFGENLSQNDMKRNIRAFGEKIRDGGIGLFYYAGHGIQVRGRNYLIPVGATITSEAEVEYESVDVGLVLAQMETARNHLNIVILDACRNNPFARSFRSTQTGLASIDAPGGTLLAYATAPGSVASDGQGRNGLYTQELLKYMKQPALSIEQLFKQVRASVRSQTEGKQIPWESSSLESDFYFSSSATATVPAKNNPLPASETAVELSFWESVKNSGDVEDYKEYLAKYPSGAFAGLARNKIRSLEAAAKPPETNTSAPAEPKSNEVTQILSVPVQIYPKDGAVFNQFPRTMKLIWGAVPNAVSYEIDFDICASHTNCQWWSEMNPIPSWFLPMSKKVVTTTEYTSEFYGGAQPGRWRVCAIGANGQKGPKSPWRTFRYKQ